MEEETRSDRWARSRRLGLLFDKEQTPALLDALMISAVQSELYQRPERASDAGHFGRLMRDYRARSISVVRD